MEYKVPRRLRPQGPGGFTLSIISDGVRSCTGGIGLLKPSFLDPTGSSHAIIFYASIGNASVSHAGTPELDRNDCSSMRKSLCRKISLKTRKCHLIPLT